MLPSSLGIATSEDSFQGPRLEDGMDIKAQRLEILQQVENGEITLEEASRWLAALDRVKSKNDSQTPEIAESQVETQESSTGEYPAAVAETTRAALAAEPQVDAVQPIEPDPVEQAQPLENLEESNPPFWRGWWLIIFFPGLLLLVAAVTWMIQGYLAAGLGWGFWLSFFPFSIGVLMIWLGWEVRMARWFHLHVTQKNKPGPHEITISFPLPVGLVSWGIRRFGQFAGPIQGRDMEGVLDELDQAVATDGPTHIFVDDQDGDQVEIWIDGPRAK
jgi:hypothetical protein